MDRVVTLAPLWERIRARRAGIIALVVSATVIAGVIAFIMPPWYKGEAELLPPSEEESSVGIASLLRGVGMPGVKIPTEVTPADLFVVILESRRISEQMVNRFDLRREYKHKLMTDAIKDLHKHAAFKVTDEGTIKISVEDKSRTRAAEMANTYIEFLDRFNREVRMSKGRRTRMFVESRLNDTKRELQVSEQKLADYQVKNKTVALSPQMSSAVEEAAQLYARRTALEVRLGVVRGYSEGSDEEIQIRQELNQLERQMRQLPTLGVELARLLREVKALEQVFAILTAQYEDARITEARDVVTVEVLDPASPPERKSKPKRSVIILSVFLVSLVLGVGYALLQRDEEKAEQPRPLRAVAAE